MSRISAVVLGITVDGAGNVYVTGLRNAFKITAAGVITEIIDETGDGAGNTFAGASRIAVDAAGNVYVLGTNGFRITPAGVSNESPDGAGGDGTGDMDGAGGGGDGTGDMDGGGGNGTGDMAPAAGGCGDGLCGAGGMMMMPLTFLGIGWMKGPRRILTRQSTAN